MVREKKNPTSPKSVGRAQERLMIAQPLDEHFLGVASVPVVARHVRAQLTTILRT